MVSVTVPKTSHRRKMQDVCVCVISTPTGFLSLGVLCARLSLIAADLHRPRQGIDRLMRSSVITLRNARAIASPSYMRCWASCRTLSGRWTARGAGGGRKASSQFEGTRRSLGNGTEEDR